MNKDKIIYIIDFWFQGADDSVTIEKSKEPFCLWFASKPEFDQTIRERFEQDLIKAKNGECKDWEETPEGRLALILLFDQFSRNIYRGTPKAYETDALALKLTMKIIEEEQDIEFQRIFRVFIYMPLMHAQDVKIQESSVRKFESLVEEAKNFASHNAPYFEWNLKYAREHRDVILKHGRFPHRDQ